MAKVPLDDRPAIVWFRRDLRLADNPALDAAIRSGHPVGPVFIFDPQPLERTRGAAGLWWLDKSLAALSGSLERLGSRLVLRRGASAALLPDLIRETGAALVAWNRIMEPAAMAGETALEAAVRGAGAEPATFNASLLFEPNAVRTKTGGAYGVFTPFWRTARTQIGHPDLARAPGTLEAPGTWPASDDRTAWGLHPRHPDWSVEFDDWAPGEGSALGRLDRLLADALQDYPAARDRPAVEGSSRLSPHLAWGEIGPRQVYCAVQARLASHPGFDSQAEKFLTELGWREFNYSALFAHPDMATQNVKPAFDPMPWRTDAGALDAWREGRTGYPIVDAGMRQLWRTGWMHNRVRLITASFLVKHLLIDWRVGEQWFWDTLVDADPANNPANWQWIAGSGADASPFFRIFNPVTQGEKFDLRGEYVRRWVPELARLADRTVHAPWTATPVELEAAGVRLGETYPKPIVEHAAARTRALAALRGLRGVPDEDA